MIKVERWDTVEIELKTSRQTANPFRDVRLSADFLHSQTGNKITVPGFYDGEMTWRVRFMPNLTGDWHWATSSNDADLHGKQGTLDCIPPEKPYLHGPLHCQGYHFFYADGTPQFLISTRLSCQFAPPAVHEKVIRFLKDHRINRVFFIMGGIAGTLKDLFTDGPDFDRYQVEKFQAIDRFIDALRQADILASPYFYYFNDGVLRGMSPEQDQAYLRYSMARFGAFANLMPVLSNEVEQKYTIRTYERLDEYDLLSHAWANEMGALLTTEANSLMATIHERMPVILQHADFSLWLDRTVTDPHRLQHLYRPYPDSPMQEWPVSTFVNSPVHNGEECIHPAG